MMALTLMLSALALVAGMFLARAALLFLIWNTLVVPTMGWPTVQFAAVVSVCMLLAVAFHLKTESAKSERADGRTPAEKGMDALKDLGNMVGVLACAYLAYGIAYAVIR